MTINARPHPDRTVLAAAHDPLQRLPFLVAQPPCPYWLGHHPLYCRLDHVDADSTPGAQGAGEHTIALTR
jgi:hypothetical protein